MTTLFWREAPEGGGWWCDDKPIPGTQCVTEGGGAVRALVEARKMGITGRINCSISPHKDAHGSDCGGFTVNEHGTFLTACIAEVVQNDRLFER